MKGSSAWPSAETRKGSSARPLATTKWVFCVGVAQSALAAALPPKLLFGLVEALLLYCPNLLLIYNIYIKVRAPGSRECTRSDLCLDLSRFFSFSNIGIGFVCSTPLNVRWYNTLSLSSFPPFEPDFDRVNASIPVLFDDDSDFATRFNKVSFVFLPINQYGSA